MARGDLISVACVWGVIPYRHYGIDIGDGTVVHLATVNGTSEMQVQRVAWDAFAVGKVVRVDPVANSLDPEHVVCRALDSVGRTGYHLALGNCEHFARACKTGESVSHQADRLIHGVLRAGVAGAVTFSSRVVSRAVLSGVPRSLVTRSAGVSSLIGELARQGAYAASRYSSLDHGQADRVGKTVGAVAAACAGTVAGGPVAGAASAALYLSIDRVTSGAVDRWTGNG